MTPEQIERERAKFEAHLRAHVPFNDTSLRRGARDGYFWNDVQIAWESWLARAEEAHRVREALERVLKSFPTDMDMHAAGWEQIEVDEACNVYDAARTALKDTE